MVTLFDIIEFTADRIDNDKNILTSMWKLFSMFKIECWWNPREDKIKHTGVKIAIICSNCGNKKLIDVDIMNNTYQYIITNFALNKTLHYVGMFWIIETHEKLQYDMDKQNSERMTGGPWYNTYICNK